MEEKNTLICPRCHSTQVVSSSSIVFPELKLGTTQKPTEEEVFSEDKHRCENCGFEFCPEEADTGLDMRQGLMISAVVFLMIIMLLIVLL